jgi:drug/metabolite transporter (DMT)-like permease
MTRQTKGIALMIATVFFFAVQDGFSRKLAGDYNTFLVVMLRYWVFASFVLILAFRRPGGWAEVRTKRPWLHLLRGGLLVLEICGMVQGYVKIGLIQSLAIFCVAPLIVVALSGVVLGERLSLRAKASVALGCVGVVVLLQPGAGVFSLDALYPLGAATLFALYVLLTRRMARDEAFFPGFFWPVIFGAVFATALGLPHWVPLLPSDLGWLAGYASCGILSNWLMQKTYQTAEASAVQPYSYFHIVFITAVGVVFFDESLTLPILIGASIVVAAGVISALQGRRA